MSLFQNTFSYRLSHNQCIQYLKKYSYSYTYTITHSRLNKTKKNVEKKSLQNLNLLLTIFVSRDAVPTILRPPTPFSNVAVAAADAAAAVVADAYDPLLQRATANGDDRPRYGYYGYCYCCCTATWIGSDNHRHCYGYCCCYYY